MYKLSNYPTPDCPGLVLLGDVLGWRGGVLQNVTKEGRQVLDVEGVSQGLGRGSAIETVALISPLGVVEAEEAIQVPLDLLGFEVPGLTAFDAEALVEKRSVHPLDEAVGPRASDLGGAAQ